MPLLIVVGILVAAAVGVAATQLWSSKKSSGAGTFSLKVTDRAVTVHDLNMKVGTIYCYRITGGDVRVGLGVDEGVIHAINKSGILSDVEAFQSDAASEGTGFFSDVNGSSKADPGKLTNHYPGYTGVFVNGYGGRSDCNVAPASGRYSLILLSRGSERNVTLKVIEKANPKAHEGMTSDELDSLQSDSFYTDSVSQMSDQLSS